MTFNNHDNGYIMDIIKSRIVLATKSCKYRGLKDTKAKGLPQFQAATKKNKIK